jgi:O-methyltransferase
MEFMSRVRGTRRPSSSAGPTEANPEELYLDLLKRCLTRSLFPERTSFDPAVRERVPFDPQQRAEGRDWPDEAETMIGLRRLDSLQDCVIAVIRESIPGDLIETGVWRGGATIFMRGVLKANGDQSRLVWVADSFQGLPEPDVDRYPIDRGYGQGGTHDALAVTLDEVKANFARYGLLDDRVRFLPGWFRETLPTAPLDRLAVLRLDGDMYESTMVALTALYPKVSPGGYVIVDDYKLARGRAAVDDFRVEHGIDEPIQQIDWTGIFWRRLS